MEAKKFRPEPVQVDIGPEDKRRTITLTDLSYRKQQDLLKKITRMLIERDTLPAAIQNMNQAIQVQMIRDKKTADEAIEIFLEKIAGIYDSLNDQQVQELLKAATDDQIRDTDFEIMGATESISLLVFILQRQFAALKNLYASLSSILNPSQKADQK